MVVSVVRPPLGAFSSGAEGLELNGANLAYALSLSVFANAPEVDALEVFLPPRDLLPIERLAECAEALLRPERRGQGRLRFHAIHNLPAVWEDGVPRVLFCQDLDLLARDRYLRDRFARGPMAISSDTHCLGHRSIWDAFRELARGTSVPHDRVVASRAVAGGIVRAFAELGVAPPFGITVRPRPIDVAGFGTAAEEGQRVARRALQLPETGQIALCLGRLTPNGKADLLPLIDAFAEARGTDDYLLIAGVENAPGYALRLAGHARQRGVGDSVIVQTVVPPALRSLFFAASDLFVFPGDSVQEAFCTSITEAMASGLPVVASDWDGVRDIVADGETGYLVPTYASPTFESLDSVFPASDFLTDFLCLAQSVVIDTDLLGERMRRLFRDVELRRRLGAEGRKRAMSAERWWAETVREWRGQLDAAAAEDPTVRETRRTMAEAAGQAMPYSRLFGHYASHVLTDDDELGLTAIGAQVLAKDEALAFYDETLPMLVPDSVVALLEAFAGGVPRRIGAVVAEAASRSRAPRDRVRFALNLLLKRGVLKIIPKGSGGI